MFSIPAHANPELRVLQQLPRARAIASEGVRNGKWLDAPRLLPLRQKRAMESLDQAESEMLHRMARQDEFALGEFYDRFAGPVYSMVLKIVRDPAEAEEVVQDAFLSVWKNAAQFDSKRSSAFTWLAMIARNKAIDSIRRSRRRLPPPAWGNSQGKEREEAAPEANPSTAAQQSERARVLSEWISELPSNQRQAVLLAFFEGLTHHEIAERLNETAGTVKSRIRLGMEKLRAKWKGGVL